MYVSEVDAGQLAAFSLMATLPQLFMPNLLPHLFCTGNRAAVSVNICVNCHALAAELSSLRDLMGTPSAFGKDFDCQAKLHGVGKQLNRWRSPVRPLPSCPALSLLWQIQQSMPGHCQPQREAQTFCAGAVHTGEMLGLVPQLSLSHTG